ncbi:hypothetical protein BESB_002540 [Besnoitia besnoiti]|uniref:Transmembrane protein n=1 Tax=Besnoitia besnoiti TaxID=94643 RepID=A0A2A9MPE0_BESBE|nr:hypothetical protein BESB_002540 [Besnoitia besnoiti]PFH37913.1 hypothetical protein BESB_002540 [Besnoitia besnoiti]
MSAAALAATRKASGSQRPLTAPAEAARRTCFICLEGVKRSRKDGRLTRDLLPCCSQCFAVVHRRCWSTYRRRQQLAAFRSRLLGQRAPSPSQCSICKTGRAGVEGDEAFPPQRRVGRGSSGSGVNGATAALQEQLLASLGRLLQDDEDDADDPPLCSGVCTCINTGILIGILLLDLTLISMTSLDALEILLLSLFVAYNFVTLQLICLAVRQRRESVGALLAPPEAAPGVPQAEGGSGSSDQPRADDNDREGDSQSATGGRRGGASLRHAQSAAFGGSEDAFGGSRFSDRERGSGGGEAEDLEPPETARVSWPGRVAFWRSAESQANHFVNGARMIWCFLSSGGSDVAPEGSRRREAGIRRNEVESASGSFTISTVVRTPFLPALELQLLREQSPQGRQRSTEELLV